VTPFYEELFKGILFRYTNKGDSFNFRIGVTIPSNVIDVNFGSATSILDRHFPTAESRRVSPFLGRYRVPIPRKESGSTNITGESSTVVQYLSLYNLMNHSLFMEAANEQSIVITELVWRPLKKDSILSF